MACKSKNGGTPEEEENQAKTIKAKRFHPTSVSLAVPSHCSESGEPSANLTMLSTSRSKLRPIEPPSSVTYSRSSFSSYCASSRTVTFRSWTYDVPFAPFSEVCANAVTFGKESGTVADVRVNRVRDGSQVKSFSPYTVKLDATTLILGRRKG
uniref:Uncharacterized protein n=1 Tax=Anopheles melas TaxID=34690 RepID=A0A182U5R1_9DIPT